MVSLGSSTSRGYETNRNAVVFTMRVYDVVIAMVVYVEEVIVEEVGVYDDKGSVV